jgi:hypothetical protein
MAGNRSHSLRVRLRAQRFDLCLLLFDLLLLLLDARLLALNVRRLALDDRAQPRQLLSHLPHILHVAR